MHVLLAAACKSIRHSHPPRRPCCLLSSGPPQLHHSIHQPVPAAADTSACWPRDWPCWPAAVVVRMECSSHAGRSRRRLPCCTWLAGLLGLCRLRLGLQPVGLQRSSLLHLLLLLLLGLLGLLPSLHGPGRRLLRGWLVQRPARLLRCCCCRLLGMLSRRLQRCTWLLAQHARLGSQSSCLLRANDGAVPSCCAW